MKPESGEPVATIMIVDDEPHNLDLLERMLREKGQFDVVAFPCGDMALAAARESAPDLVLLDIMMPEMDGYEVCRRIKEDQRLKRVPVIVQSALTDPIDKVKAFREGAVDYVAKPLDEAEVLARVRTHLELRRYQFHMEKLVRLRTGELAEANRRLRIWDEAKDDWLGVLSHEMRTPLTGIFGVADFIFGELPADSPLQDFRPDYEAARRRMQKLIDDAHLLTSIDVASDRYRMIPVSLRTAIDGAVAGLKSTGVEIERLSGLEDIGDAAVMADPVLLFQACSDLLVAAALCVPDGGRVSMDASIADGTIHLMLHTDGARLPPAAIEMFFEVGGQRKLFRGGGDLGLGPALAARIVELFKGWVSVANGSRRGIVIKMALPAAEADMQAITRAMILPQV